MASAVVQLLVQDKDSLDISAVLDFVSSISDVRLVLVHSSLRDELALFEFFNGLVGSLKVPFLGVRVMGSMTRDGFVDNAVVVSVLSGDFDVSVYSARIDLEDPSKTSKEMIANLEGVGLCLCYSAALYRDFMELDAALRSVQSAFPGLQLAGANSAPSPMVACNEGVFEDRIVYACLLALILVFTGILGFAPGGMRLSML